MSGPAIPASFGARQAMPAEGFALDARSILAGLFDQVNPEDLPADARAALEAQQHIAQAAARLFASDDGRTVLEWLCDVTLRRPVFMTQLGLDPMQAHVHGAFREGQNALVFAIMAAMAEGRQEQPPQREGT